MIGTLLPPAAEMLLALAANWPQHDVRESARQLTSPPNRDGAQGATNLVGVASRQAETNEPTLD